jgi:outer membrane protein assembly factor BamB
MHLRQVFAIALVVAGGVGAQAAGTPKPGVDWPQFRGIRAGGVAEGFPLTAAWDMSSGRGVRWKTAIPGLGLSSPVVWGDLVCLSTSISGQKDAGLKVGLYGNVTPVTDDTEHEWRVYCLDKTSGAVRWQQTVVKAVPKIKRHTKSSHANSTLATDGERLIAFFGSEGLYAYDLKGKLLWKKDLGVLNSGWFFDPDYEWGIGSSPIIYKNMAIVQCDIQRGSFLAAFDTATGKEIWRTQREEIPSWSTPTIFEANGKAELITQATTFPRGYDPMTGKELWKYSGNSEIAIPTPIIGPGFVVITNGYRGVQPIVAVKPGATGDITLKAPETKGEFVAWSTTRGGPYIPTPVIYGDQLYILQGNGVLAAYKVATGERIYQERLGGTGGSFSASPVAADGKIYLSSEDGDVFVVKAGPAYELLSKNPIGEVLMATPAISDGLIIFRGLKNVYAIKAQ